MAKQRLFEYAVLYHPKAKKNQEVESEIVLFPTIVLASDEKEVFMRVARELPDEFMSKLDRVEILTRPF